MKVRFLKAGGWAPEKVGAAQFNFEVGDVRSGISENDVADMKKAGIAEVIGDDEDEADESVEAPALEGDNEESKSDATITSNSMSGNGEKPWAQDKE